MLFRDRREAGQILASQLTGYAGRPDLLVLAVPRGGVPVAYEVARALRAPLALFTAAGLPDPDDAGSPSTSPPWTVLLVDDGLASELVLRLAVASLRQPAVRRVVLALPVTTPAVHTELEGLADEVVCARPPESSRVVGHWYQDFSPTTAAEVRDLLHRRAASPTAPSRQWV